MQLAKDQVGSAGRSGHRNPSHPFLKRAQQGVEIFGALKGAYEIGRQIYTVGQAIAPYAATGVRMAAALL